MKKLFSVVSLFFIVLFLGRNLNPFSSSMFTFHDSTQPVRIQQFVKELKNFHIPPRTAPDMNYGLGFPVFNFYAPSSYWITSLFNLIGFDAVSSLKLSFFLALVVAFFGSYLFLKSYFEFVPSLLGGFLYITSLYFPLNIFVRGNLAEVWFLALFPLVLFFLYKNSLKIDKKTFITTSIVLSFLLTSHNILSLVSLPIIIVFPLLLKNKRQNFLSLSLALLLTAYFWLPALAEMKFTWAREVATLTRFRNHFLCFDQLWQSSWGFGGSTEGCINDGMSFMIGKIQLVFFGLGVFLFIYRLIRHSGNPDLIGSVQNPLHRFWSRPLRLAQGPPQNDIIILLFFLFLTLLHLFLTLYQSQFLWELFIPFSSIIQFPWRLIAPPLLGIAFFSTYFLNTLKIPFKNQVLVAILIFVLIINGKYFKGQEITKKEFEKRYLSQVYLEKKAAYAVAEYLPKTIDYKYWRSLENKKEIPMEFFAKASIEPFDKNNQTPVEKIGNIITLLTIFGLTIRTVLVPRTVLGKKSWKL